MSRMTARSMSPGIAAQLWGRAVVPTLLLGLLIWRWPTTDVASLPLAIAPVSRSVPADVEVIEFRLPEDCPSEEALIIVGSLGDAGDVDPVTIESVPIHELSHSGEIEEVRFKHRSAKAER